MRFVSKELRRKPHIAYRKIGPRGAWVYRSAWGIDQTGTLWENWGANLAAGVYCRKMNRRLGHEIP